MSVFNIKNVEEEKNEAIDKPLVMIVDDELENINVLRQLLESKFQIIAALDGIEALKLINNMLDPNKIQLIICDQRMPEMTGVEFFVKIIDKMPDTIRIILTGFSDTQTIIDSINKAKLYKFMTKPFDPVELSLAVQRGIEAHQMRKKLIEYTQDLEQKVKQRTEELEQKNKALNEALERLEKVSLTDQLTGANNRRYLSNFVVNELAKLQSDPFETQVDSPSNLGFIMLDIDHFKSVNDRFGHDAGDQVLIQLVEVITSTCCGADWVVRWGGEEFVVVAKFSKRDELHSLAERIRTNIENTEFNLDNKQTIQRTVSMGIASYPFIKNQFDAITWEQTLSMADLALYSVKNSGRNAWVSLFENDNSDAEPSVFQQVADNLQFQIEQGVVCYESSLDRDKVKFV